MARLNAGIFGGILGVMGNVEGYMLNGEYILRSRRKKTDNPPTQKQSECREKMKVVNNFLTKLTPYVMLGFANATKRKTASGYNAATSYFLKHVITGSYPNFSVDYTKVKLTCGSIDIAHLNPEATLQGNRLVFTWKSDSTFVNSTQRTMLLAYAPSLNEAIYTLYGAKRTTGTDTLLLPDDWQNIPVETYLSFIKENQKQCSDSVYVGRITAAS